MSPQMVLFLGVLIYFGCMALVAVPLVALAHGLVAWRAQSPVLPPNDGLARMIDAYIELRERDSK